MMLQGNYKKIQSVYDPKKHGISQFTINTVAYLH